MFKIIIRKLRKSCIIPDQKGFTLLEVLIAVVLTAIIGTGIFVGLRTLTLLYVDTNTHEISKDIAASDIDYVLSQPYGSAYTLPSSPAEYNNYTSSIQVTALEQTEQQIKISISFNNSIVFTLTDYRTFY